MPNYIEISIQDSQKEANLASLHSINENGLTPLSKIPKNIVVNYVTQTHAIDGSISVNHINMGTNLSRASLALNVAINEEYCGVYGICLERQWPFQRLSSPTLFSQEASERLMNSIVFVLKPPTKNIGFFKVRGAERPIDIAVYETLSQDGFAQSRDKSVITGKKMIYTPCVTEIKTPHRFSMEEVYAVLVPTELLNLASPIFTNLKIIPVETKNIVLESLPKTLHYYHGEEIKRPLHVSAPDYLSALSNYCNEIKLCNFSLHAVRLHTSFDFIARPVYKFTGNESLLEENQAKVVAKYEDNSAWIIVHKNFGVSKSNLFTHLATHISHEMLSGIISAHQPATDRFELLNSLKGDLSLSIIYKDLSEIQLSLLKQANIKVLKLDHFFMLSYPLSQLDFVERTVLKFNATEHSATKIQTQFRSLRSQGLFQECIEKQTKLKIAQAEFDFTYSQLTNTL